MGKTLGHLPYILFNLLYQFSKIFLFFLKVKDLTKVEIN